MQAIILAAGLGERLKDLTDRCPKALVQVSGRELIARVMDFLDHDGISERIVVTGFEAEKLEQFLKEHYPDAIAVCNPDYRAGNVLSMKAAIPSVRGEFIIMNADHIYPRRMLEKILDSRGDGIMAICDFDRNLGADDMKVRLGEDGHLTHISKELDLFDGGYIGMTYCSPRYVDRYREALFATIAEKGDGACVENVLGTLAEGQVKIGICDTSGIPWLEVDNQDDLRLAERILGERPDFSL